MLSGHIQALRSWFRLSSLLWMLSKPDAKGAGHSVKLTKAPAALLHHHVDFIQSVQV